MIQESWGNTDTNARNCLGCAPNPEKALPKMSKLYKKLVIKISCGLQIVSAVDLHSVYSFSAVSRREGIPPTLKMLNSKSTIIS